jgi:hypothetical protein
MIFSKKSKSLRPAVHKYMIHSSDYNTIQLKKSLNINFYKTLFRPESEKRNFLFISFRFSNFFVSFRFFSEFFSFFQFRFVFQTLLFFFISFLKFFRVFSFRVLALICRTTRSNGLDPFETAGNLRCILWL